MAEPEMHVVLYGNPLDGYAVIGPFGTGDEAVEWASCALRDDDAEWWAALLRPRSEYQR